MPASFTAFFIKSDMGLHFGVTFLVQGESTCGFMNRASDSWLCLDFTDTTKRVWGGN